MSDLRDRQIVVTVDTLRITGLRMTFEVQRNLRPEPNTASLAIYNLSEDSRKKLQQKLVPVTIEAGYRGNISQLFKGTMRNVSSTKDGVDWITRMEAGDGRTTFREARILKSFKKADYKQTVMAIADVLTAAKEIGKGNLEEALSKSPAINTWAARPVVLKGLAVEQFDKYMAAGGFEWSIQDGQLQVSLVGEAFGATAILLSQSTGLIGSPEIGETSSGKTKKNKRTMVKARSLLQPGLVPGRKVDIRSQQVTGLFRVELVRASGDNYGQDWYSDMELQAL